MIVHAFELAAGVLLGAGFYGGLWLTCLRGLYSKRPWALFLASAAARFVVALGGIYLVCGTSGAAYAFCMAGFFAGRIAVEKNRLAKIPKAGGSPCI